MNRLRTEPLAATVLAVLLFFCPHAAAAPASAETAGRAVQGWLRLDKHPLGQNLASEIKRIEEVKDAAGQTAFYVVHLKPSGYVVLSADDELEPMVAFSATGEFDAGSRSPLATMLRRDLPHRLAQARLGRTIGSLRAKNKWKGMLFGFPSGGPSDTETDGNIVAISQVIVAPFIQTLWNQQVDVSLTNSVYNYYTPGPGAGSVNNDPCGCVATAMAQTMYYYHYPTAGVGTGSYAIYVDGNPQSANLLGGNGSGGPYQWSQMPLSPDDPATAQAQAIGALCYDSGVAVGMQYSAGDSAADLGSCQSALTSVFLFSHANYTENDTVGITGTNLLAMINPNLHARLPVILGIEDTNGNLAGHCVLVDGYGYSGGTMFHHVNCGWAGDDDVWYNFPGIDTDNGDFGLLDAVIYNIYTNGTGEILAGRVTDPAGAPVMGATIFASNTIASGSTFVTTTDSNGVYALVHLPSSSQFHLTVSNNGYATASGNYATATSRNGVTSHSTQLTSGDIWNANFTLAQPLLVMPETGFASIGPVGGPFSVTSAAFILTNSSAAPINWMLSNPANWLTASSSSGTLPAGGATTLSISLSSAANSLAASTNAGTITISNQGSGLAQALNFVLTVKAGDYPIAVTGFNQDVVVENSAISGDALMYASAFDTNNHVFGSQGQHFAFYEAGLATYNTQIGAPGTQGLPVGGLFTSDADNLTTFQFAPYSTNNVLLLSSTNTSGTLSLNAPAAYTSLSILSASALGGGTGTLILHFADGSMSSPVSYNSFEYFATNNGRTDSLGEGAAITNFGVLFYGDLNVFTVFEFPYDRPAFYQTTVNLQSLSLQTKAITSVTFNRATGAQVTASTSTGVFAVSGTESPYPVFMAQPTNIAVASGAAASFSAPVEGASLNYSWLFNGSPLNGATANPLNFASVTPSNAGNYQLVISNASGAVTSSVVTLSITNLPVSFAANGPGLSYSPSCLILQLTNLLGQGPVVISASTNLTTWTPIYTNPSGFGSITVTDAAVGLYPFRFYRATVP